MRAPTDAGPRAHPATPRNRGRRDAQPSQEGEPTGVPEAEAPASGRVDHPSPLEPPVARIPAAVTEEAEYVRLGTVLAGPARNPIASGPSLEEAPGQAGVDPDARAVPGEAVGRPGAAAHYLVPTTTGAWLAVTTVLVKLSGGDVTSGTIHHFVLLLDRKGTGGSTVIS